MKESVSRLRSELGHLAIFFYNEYTPDVVGCLWRPDAFKGQPFSAMYSEYQRPIDNKWEKNSLIITNASDAMRVVRFIVRDIAVDIKILDDRSVKSEEDEGKKEQKGTSDNKRKRVKQDSDDDDSSSSDEE